MNVLNNMIWTKDDETGIWFISGYETNTAFSDKMQNRLMKLEDTSWWFMYRADVIIRQMNSFFHKDLFTLDIGGGNGYTTHIAKNQGYRIGILEPTFTACLNAKKRGIDEIYCGAITEDSIVDESIDQILLLDVLEHIEDDESFLMLLFRKLVRGGMLLITVPAFQSLWSSEDDAAGHFRRYRIANLTDKLRKQGFDICYQSYYMWFLFLPILVVRVFLEKLGIVKPSDKRSDDEKEKINKSQFRVRNRLIISVLNIFERIELSLMRKENRVPFGGSIIVIARKH